ncbi:hypothetical protein BDZ45DRAFT_748848 [Acephala macrosclerotiorum]|nr:hypothetical protein BDZ45DRAFT_748848 [Acephala macrosclerotiorum]
MSRHFKLRKKRRSTRRLGDTPGAFYPFSAFPTELRLMIWTFTLPTASYLIPYTTDEILAAAYVNRESRSVYFTFYTKCFVAAPLRTTRWIPFHALCRSITRCIPH